MADVQLLAGLVDRHTAGRESIWDRLWAAIVASLTGAASSDFYRHATQEQLAGELAAASTAACAAVGGLTVEYLDALLVADGVTPSRKVPALPRDLRGTPAEEVWLRPFEQYRYAYSLTADDGQARDAMLVRAEQIADTDLTLAARQAGVNHASVQPAVTGYRRVVRPELSRGKVCGLCLVASDRVYSKSELMPIHTHCHCTVAEITTDHDPGNSLNGVTLQQLYDEAGGNRYADLRKTRYRVEAHGELGPILVDATPETVAG